MSTFWIFWLGIMVAVLILLTLIRRYRKNPNLQAQTVQKPLPQQGLVRYLEYVYKGIGGMPATCFEIHLDNGTILYAGFDGHYHDIASGDVIEFELSTNFMLVKDVPMSRRNADGSTTRWTETLYYYELKWYKVFGIPEADDGTTELAVSPPLEN